MAYARLVISSGHGKYVRGASGELDEVDEARRVVEQLAKDLRARGAEVLTFHDNTSHSQNENLNTIVNFHNKQIRDLDVSVHFNAFEETTKPMGTECLYVSQSELATQVAAAIAGATGLPNRGPKKRTDLFFLNQTNEPAILIETVFVDSTADAESYHRTFEQICAAVADVLGGKEMAAAAEPPAHAPTPPTAPDTPPETPPGVPPGTPGTPAGRPPPPVEPPPAAAATVALQIAVSGRVRVTVNGQPVDVGGPW